MKKIEKRIKQDLINKMDVDLAFDSDKLEIEEIEVKENKKFNKKVWIPTFSTVGLAALVCALIIPLIGKEVLPIPVTDKNVELVDKKYNDKGKNVTTKQGRYKENEINNLVKAKILNENLLEARTAAYDVFSVSEEFKQAMYDFANTTYTALEKETNISYSPYGLYSMLNTSALATISNDTIYALNSVLGLSKQEREQNMLNAYKTNYFVNEVGTLQVSNASFQTTDYEINPEYVSDLTKNGVEGYAIDFTKDDEVQIMLDWIDQKVNEQGFLTKDQIIQNPDLTTLVLLSTLYFKNDWKDAYEEIDAGPTFITNNNEEVIAKFMNHHIMGSYYDYDSYITFKDYFHNGQSVKFIVSKDSNASISELTKDKNLFIDDISKKVKDVILDVTMPEFSNECFLTLNDMLKEIGLSVLYQNGQFSRPFKNLTGGNDLSNVIQKNKVAFDKNGAEIKSVTAGSFAKTSIDPDIDINTLEIKLQNPFIYIVYDANDLPLFIGHVDNVPSYNA